MGSSTVLECFPKLLRDNNRERLTGATNLLKYLSANSDQSKELRHVLVKVIRGLGSPKIAPRKGFYSTLTVYLILHHDIKIDTILEIMESELKASRSNDKGENGDIHNGRILTCGALIRSKFLKICPSDKQLEVLKCLVHSGKQRSYLGFEYATFLVEFLDQFDENDDLSTIWPLLEEEFCKPLKEHNLDTFYVLLVIDNKFSNTLTKKVKKRCLGSSKIINDETIPEILRILSDIPRRTSRKHPVFETFYKKLMGTEYVEKFWLAVDERFAKPSKTDKFVGTEIFRLILENLQDKLFILNLLSRNYLKYMLNRFFTHAKQKNDEIKDSFKQSLIKITSILDKETEGSIKLDVVKKLILYPGDLLIEKKTGTKVIQVLIDQMAGDTVKKLAKLYRQISTNKKLKEKDNSVTEPWTNVERKYAAQILSVKLLSHPDLISDKEWRIEQLQFLFEIGFCESDSIGVELAPNFKESFFRALDHKLPSLKDLNSILDSLVTFINTNVFENQEFKLRVPLEEETTKSWTRMLNLRKKLDKLSTSSAINKNISTVFQTMNLHMGLQLFSDPEMATSAINELQNCVDRLTSSQKNNSETEEEPEWIEVVVDLLLFLLSKNCHLFRSLIGCVFPHLCDHLTPASIHQILAVLDVKSGKNPLSSNKDGDDDDSDDEEMESQDEEDKHENENEEEEDEDEEDEDENLEEESDFDPEESDIEEDTVTDKLRLAVSQALGDARMQTDDEDMDVDQIDEEEGKRLDESLAAAFKILKRSKRSQSKKQEKSAQALTHFRTRVIDLLEIYLETNPSMALVLDMLLPLFAVLEFSIKDAHQKPLEHRVNSCLKKLSGALKRFKDTKDVDEELLTTVLKGLIEKGERSAAVCQDMGDKLSECCVFLVRCLQMLNISPDSFTNIFGQQLTAFFKNRDCILPALVFKSLLQLVWVGNWKLAELLVNLAFDTSIRSYRRTQALEFLKTFYHNSRLISSEEHLDLRKKIEGNLYKLAVEVLKELANTDSSENSKSVPEMGKELKQKYVSSLFSLLMIIYNHQIAEVWDWSQVAKAMSKYRSNVVLSSDSKKSYNKLARRIGAEINVQNPVKNSHEVKLTNGKSHPETPETLDTSENSTMDNSTVVTEKKKKHKKNDKQKLKKESRELRAKVMAEGLEDVSFSGLMNGFSKEIHEVEDNNTETQNNKTGNKRPALHTHEGSSKKKKKNIDENE